MKNITINVAAIVGFPIACGAAWLIGGWQYALLTAGVHLCLTRP